MDMNTAAIAEFHHQQDKNDRDYQTFGVRVVEDLIAEILEGHAVTKVRGIKVDLAFILDGQGFIPDEVAALLVTATKEERLDMLDQIEERARVVVKEWTEYSDTAADVIAERVRDRVLEATER